MDLDPIKLKIKLQAYGAKIDPIQDDERKGGAGPIGKCFILPNHVIASVPLKGHFIEKSQYQIHVQKNKHILYFDEKPLLELREIPSPHFYQKRTEKGVPMKKIARLHGVDCLASTIYQKCLHWEKGKQCKFCSIEFSYLDGETVLEKSPDQLVEVAVEAQKEGIIKHVILTTGTPDTHDFGVKTLSHAVRAIKNETHLPVHVQLEPPDNSNLISQLKEAGADTIGLHIESFDRKILERICPAKNDPRKFLKIWKLAVEEFGDNQVSSYLIMGLGEDDQSIISGAEEMARIGVIPFPVPLRPHPKTALRHYHPPNHIRTLKLYSHISDIINKYGLKTKQCSAGCIRCGACSAITDFIN